jgi:hypothetical protein
MNNVTDKLNGWVTPEMMGRLEDMNLWLFALPLIFMILGFAIWFVRPIKDSLVLLFSVSYLLIAGFFIYDFAYLNPEQKEEETKAEYLDWFDENYGYLGLSEENALQVLDSTNGYLDEEAKRHYLLETSPESGNEKFLYMLTKESQYSYSVVPQKEAQ